METCKRKMPDIKVKIAAKLFNDSYSLSENWDLDKAKHIINKCVGSVRLMPILEANENEIIGIMKTFTRTE